MTRQQLTNLFFNKQDKPQYMSGLLGDMAGNIEVPERPDYVYVRVGNNILQILNNTVPNIYGLPVIIGYRPDNPNILQIMNVNDGATIRNVNNNIPFVKAHAASHQWLHPEGGTDTVFMELRQFLPFGMYKSDYGNFYVQVQRGLLHDGTEWRLCEYDPADLTSHVPSLASQTGTARYVLGVIDENCELSWVDGNVVAIPDITLADIPDTPATALYTLGAVLLYHGQIKIAESKDKADIVDMRFPGKQSATSGATRLVDLTDVTGTPDTTGQLVVWDEENGYFEFSSNINDYTTEDDFTDTPKYGFVINYDGSQRTYLTFDGSNTVSVSPVTGSSTWEYWRNGTKCTVSGTKSINLAVSPPSAKAFYYIYLNSTDGTLSKSTASWTLEDLLVPVCTIDWDDTLTPKYTMADERHSCLIDRRFHWEHHFAEGSELITSPALSGYSVAQSLPTNAHNTFSIGASVAADEDIKIINAALADSEGLSADYFVKYRMSGSWSWENSLVPFRYTAGGYIQWDNAGVMTQGQQSKYYNTYLLVTNTSGSSRYTFIHGQHEYGSLASAQEESFTALTKTGINIYEFIAIFQFTWNTSNAYSTYGKCRLAAEPFPIKISVTGLTSPGSIVHNNLPDLQGGTSGEYYHLTEAQKIGLTTGTATSLHTHLIGSLSGVSIGSPNTGDVLTYVSGTWVSEPSSAGSTHNGLSGIQGGAVNDYYHLTQAQQIGLTTGTATTLHTHTLGTIDGVSLGSPTNGVYLGYMSGTWTSLAGGSGDHNNLTGLQGGSGSQYYHLDQSQHNQLTNGGQTALHSHVGGYAHFADGRLTLESGVPISTTNQTAKGTLYYTPYIGDNISLWDGNEWVLYTFTERSLSLTGIATYPYDVFAYNVSGTVTLESLVWTSTSARATAIVALNGVWVKDGDATRRYLGTIMPSGANTCEDSIINRLVWNVNNQVPRMLFTCPGYTDNNAGATFTKTAGNFSEANGGTGSRLYAVIGIGQVIPIHASSYMKIATAGTAVLGVGVNSATSASASMGSTSTNYQSAAISIAATISPGYNYVALLVAAVSNTATYNIDGARLGSTADPQITTISTQVMG